MVPQEKARLKMASDLGFGNLTVNELFATTNATLMNYVVQQLQVGYFLRIPPAEFHIAQMAVLVRQLSNHYFF